LGAPVGISAEIKKADGYRTFYASGVQFTGTGEDVRFHFWTNEIVPEAVRTESVGPNISIPGRMHIFAVFQSEVIMSFPVFEKFAELVAQQFDAYKKAREQQDQHDV